MSNKNKFLNVIESQRKRSNEKRFHGTFLDYLDVINKNPELPLDDAVPLKTCLSEWRKLDPSTVPVEAKVVGNYLNGLKIDFRIEKNDALSLPKLVYENPQEIAKCGCGSSVTF